MAKISRDVINLPEVEAKYASARAALIAYLKMKVDQADWHAVSDAANDLRVLEAERG